MKFLTAAFVVSIMFLYGNKIQAEELPKVCSEGALKTVQCRCNDEIKGLEFKQGLLKDKFKDITKFIVSDCSGSVVFKTEAFKALDKLENLEINNVKNVVMESDVFDRLDDLTISKVEELEFKSSAFDGAQLKRLTIHGSKITKLPQFSFYNIQGLQKFDLIQVNINEVEAKAISLNITSTVRISSTTVENIASNGIEFDAEQISLVDSDFKGLKDGSVTLKVIKQLDILRNKLEFDSTSSPLIAIASDVNIIKNHFTFLSKDILSNIHSHKTITFLGNMIAKFDSPKPQEEIFKNWDARDNKFQCTCELLEIFNNVADSQLGKNNFCNNNCTFSLKQAKEECSKKPTVVLDNNYVCKLSSKKTSQGDTTRPSRENTKDKPHSGTVANLGSFFWAIMTPWFLLSIL